MNLSELFQNAPFAWFIIGLAFALLELAIPGFILIFFAFGAWLVALLSLFIDMDLAVQILIFAGASTVSLVLLRKRLRSRFFQEKTNETGELDDEFKGKKVLVIEDITPEKEGKVEFKGANWTAKSDTPISKGTTVEIVGKESICLIVKP